MKKKMQRVLEYIAIGLMVLNIVGYGVRKSISCIALFGMGAYIARCFSKNLTINIFAGLLVSNVFFGCSDIREGWDIVGDVKKAVNKRVDNVKKAVNKRVDNAKTYAQKQKDDMVNQISSNIINAQNQVTSRVNDATKGVTSRVNDATKGVRYRVNDATKGYF